MKKLNSILMSSLIGLITIGCTQELDQPGPNPDGEMIRIQLDAPEIMQLTRGDINTNSASGD